VNINITKVLKMEENFNIDEAKAALEKQINDLKNKEYSDWDSLQITLVLKDESKGNIRMMRQDMEAMANLHGQSRSEIIEMMIQTLEEEYKNQTEPK
jgi:hypothetical protein